MTLVSASESLSYKGLNEVISFPPAALLSDQVVVFERAVTAAVCLACINIVNARSELAC